MNFLAAKCRQCGGSVYNQGCAVCTAGAVVKTTKYIGDAELPAGDMLKRLGYGNFWNNPDIGDECYPDFLIPLRYKDGREAVIMFEVDEEQHVKRPADYEVNRMMFMCRQAAGRNCIFIRYNPSTPWSVDDSIVAEALRVASGLGALDLELDYPSWVCYLFYAGKEPTTKTRFTCWETLDDRRAFWRLPANPVSPRDFFKQ